MGTRILKLIISVLCLIISLTTGAFGQISESSLAPSLNLTPAEQDWLQAHQTIRLGVDPQWPPFEFIEKDGTYHGIASETVRIVSDRLGISMDVIQGLSWTDVLESAKNRQLDVLPCAAQTQDRDKYLLFTKPYLNIPIVLVVRTDAPYISGFHDLHGKSVAVIKSYPLHDKLPKEYPQVDFHVTESAEEALKSVSEGKTFAFAGNLATTAYLIQKLRIKNLEIAAPTPYSYVLSFGIRKDWPELVGIMNKALATITQQEKTKISQKWISLGRYSGLDYSLVMKGTAVAGGILSLILLWNFYIRKQREKLRKSEEELQRIMDSMPNIVFVTDPQGRKRMVNRQWELLTGKTGQDSVGKTYHELFGKKLADRFNQMDKEVLNTLQTLSTEESIKTPKGKSTFLQNLVPLIDPEGKPYAVCGSMTDITQLKQTEQKLAEALEESDRHLTEAAEYVRSLIPTPIAERGIHTDWRFIPSAALGGDSFGYHWIDDRHFAIYLVDVSGHGVSAALLSVTIINVLRSHSLQNTDFRMPDQVLTSLNSAFPMEKQGGMYFTMWYGVYDTMSRSLTFSSAGHPPALLFEGNSSAYSGLRRLQTGNLFIGGLPDTQFQTERIVLGETNRLFVYSDGVFEISTVDGSMWSFSQFEDFMARFSKSDRSVVQQVLGHAQEINQTDVFEDDFSILEVGIKLDSG